MINSDKVWGDMKWTSIGGSQDFRLGNAIHQGGVNPIFFETNYKVYCLSVSTYASVDTWKDYINLYLLHSHWVSMSVQTLASMQETNTEWATDPDF